MGHLEPSVALLTCERALRDLFEAAFPATYGDEWLEKVASEQKLAAWEEKRTTEVKRRTTRGVAAVPSNLLAYAEFHDLVSIAGKHWPPLHPALGPRAETLPLLHRFERLRNTVAHSRATLPFEDDLLAGIAGEIRNRVTRYMSDQDPGKDYFARIESVTDSFGHEARPLAGSSGTFVAVTEFTIRVGDRVRFTCRATDPHGRGISWWISTTTQGRWHVADGGDVTIDWAADETQVGLDSEVRLFMRADAAHHRQGFGGDDGLAIFRYTVLPRDST